MPKAEDEKILADLTKQCADKTAEYEDLKMVRANEEAAVAQAILILNSDAAFESVDATAAETSGNTGFNLLRYSTTVRRQVRHLLEIAKEKDESNAEQRRTWSSRSQAENVNFSAGLDSWKSDKQVCTRWPRTTEPDRGELPAEGLQAWRLSCPAWR